MYDPPSCIDCGVCQPGEYIPSGQCSGVVNASNGLVTVQPNCQQCPLCEEGKYLVKRCTGTSYGTPDHICQPCASCPQDTYVAPCAQQGNMSLVEWSGSAVPPDAGRCVPCGNCSSGYYTSTRCDGKVTTDVHQCSKCNSKCPFGTYMLAACKGNTFEFDSNDCR